MTYEKPDLSIDTVLLTLIQGRIHVALMLRDAPEPASQRSKWSITGGYVHTDEDINDLTAAKRILRTKLDFEPRYMEQAWTEANATRDERGWSASIVYLALHEPGELQDLAAKRGLLLVDAEDDGTHLPANMAFDHRKLVLIAVQKLRHKARYTTITAHFLPQQFLLSDFHEAFQAVRKAPVNIANFRNKILKENVLVEMDDRLFSKGRPGTGYFLKEPITYFDRVIA
jgi:ADP-ribose pyrophosphatase YjhB (NUDIX family)